MNNNNNITQAIEQITQQHHDSLIEYNSYEKEMCRVGDIVLTFLKDLDISNEEVRTDIHEICFNGIKDYLETNKICREETIGEFKEDIETLENAAIILEGLQS